MIFQYLQNTLHLTSAHMHILFIVLMGLYLALRITGKKEKRAGASFHVSDTSLEKLVVTDDYGNKYTYDRNTGIWHDSKDEEANAYAKYILDMNSSAWFDAGEEELNREIRKSKRTSGSDFITSVLVGIVLGLESWMLTMAISAFLPEAVIGKATFSGELGREFGDLAYQLLSYISLFGIFVVPIVGVGLLEGLDFGGDRRISLTVLAGSILPIYSFIYAIMPVNTGIFFGVSALSETVLLIIGLILELGFGGWFGFVNGLLEYTVSFALFSSLYTFPALTKNFFAVLGFIVVLAGAAYFLMMSMSGISDSDGNVFNEAYVNVGRLDYGDAGYQITNESWDKLEVKDDYTGDEYIFNKNTNTWTFTDGSAVPDPSRRGLDDLSRFH